MKPGDLIDSKYRIESVLSLHGFRQRFIGLDIKTNSRVIIDTLHDSMLESPTAIATLRYEIELSNKLNGPYFMGVIDSFTENNRLFVIWKYIDAQPLSHNESLNNLNPRDISRFTARLIRALATAHEKGTIHGAISTDAILITPQLEPVITGFSLPGVEPITDPGVEGGISAYRAAAPELFHGEPIDESCDFYSVGVIAQYLFSLIDESSENNPNSYEQSGPFRPIKPIDSAEIDRAKSLIRGLTSTSREYRIQSALQLADPSFLDSLSTPAGGNEVIKISKKELRSIKRGLKPPKPPRSDQTEILIAVSIKAAIIAAAALSVLFLVAKLVQ